MFQFFFFLGGGGGGELKFSRHYNFPDNQGEIILSEVEDPNITLVCP